MVPMRSIPGQDGEARGRRIGGNGGTGGETSWIFGFGGNGGNGGSGRYRR